jgi:hypothetical protein
VAEPLPPSESALLPFAVFRSRLTFRPIPEVHSGESGCRTVAGFEWIVGHSYKAQIDAAAPVTW